MLTAGPSSKTDSSTVSSTAEGNSTLFRPWDAHPRFSSPPPTGPGPSSPPSPEFLFHKKIRKVLLAQRGPQKPEALKHKKEVAAVFVTPRGIFVRDVSAF